MERCRVRAIGPRAESQGTLCLPVRPMAQHGTWRCSFGHRANSDAGHLSIAVQRACVDEAETPVVLGRGKERAGADSHVAAAGADEVFNGPAGFLAQGISLLVGTATWEDEHVETRQPNGDGPHVFGAADLPRARRDGPQSVNERLGLIAVRLLVKDAGADGAYDRGGFPERLNQLALREPDLLSRLVGLFIAYDGVLNSSHGRTLDLRARRSRICVARVAAQPARHAIVELANLIETVDREMEMSS